MHLPLPRAYCACSAPHHWTIHILHLNGTLAPAHHLNPRIAVLPVLTMVGGVRQATLGRSRKDFRQATFETVRQVKGQSVLVCEVVTVEITVET